MHPLKSLYIKLFSVILIACLGILAYSNTFHCPFQFDDAFFIVHNTAIRDISNLQHIWDFLPCRFILYLSFALNYHFHQLNVWGYHLVNLAVHIASAILVWWLVLLTLSTPVMRKDKILRHAQWIALLAGLIFVAHPLQTESVTYIVQRAASMATMFYLASLCFYVKSRLIEEESGSGRVYYTLAIVSAILAMFTKETAITLPLMIVLYEITFLNTKRFLHWKRIVPLLLLLIVIPLTMFLTRSANAISSQEMQIALEGRAQISSMHYFLTELRAIITYIRLAFLPFHQNLDYDYPVFKSIFEWPVFISFVLISSILLFAKHLFFKYRLISFSICWFFLALLPESSIFPLKEIMYEHRLYLPLAGYSIFLAAGAYYILEKNNFKAFVFLILMAVMAYSFLTFQRNKVWRDDLSLWDDTLKKSPHSARANNNHGLVMDERGEFAQAIADYNHVIAIKPDAVSPYKNLAVVYYQLKQYDKAWDNVHKVEGLGSAMNPDFLNLLKAASKSQGAH